MAWKVEVEPNGDEAIVITFPNSGIAKDPYSGLNKLYSVNLSVPNEISVGYPITTSTTSGATLGVPCARSVCWFAAYKSVAANGSPARFAILDKDGHVFETTSITGTWTFLSSSNSTTGSTANDGIAYWLGYLFKFRNGSVDYWDGTTWTTAWQSITPGVRHFAYVGSDNVLYFTNGNYLGSIALTNPGSPSSFDPTSSGTYIFTTTKLQLPQTDLAISIGEVGGGNTPQSTLLVGGIQNAVYPWDKTSASFNFPIFVADNYIQNIVSANQNAFIFAGKGTGTGGRGRIFITNGAQADEYFKMPDYIFGVQDPYYAWGDAIFHRNNLLFGAFVIPNSTASPLTVSEVWALDFDTKAFRSVSDIITNATGKGNATVLMSTYSLSTPGFGYIIGWDDNGAAPGIGYSGTTVGTGPASILTDLMDIGSFIQRKTFSQVEVKFRTALQTNESVSVTPIVDTGATNTVPLVFSPTLVSGTFSASAPVNFQATQWLQFQITMTGANALSGCRLYEIRLR